MEPNDAEKDHAERRNSNTEYVPTKCRITKPPPPKPAANPLQFIKVDPSPLFQKAKEQIKKVEEIKKERKEIREETEDWQANLDNWKSSRRKRQEHIIERVVEVKKIELEEIERSRRKSKTFSEMMEERNKNKGRHKYIIPLYDDDSNDLSDYGIGSSSSKTNSIKDVDTDDSCSILDEKDQFETASNKDVSSNSNQSQSEDESNIRKNSEIELPHSVTTYSNQLSSIKPNIYNDVYQNAEPKEHYTYEGAIEDYRSRIKTKINDSIFTKSIDVVKGKEFSEAQTAVPKGVIFKRKELFDKPVEINHYESNTTRRLSEDFANSQSIKQRLQNLEKCSDISIKSVDKSNVQLVSVKNRLQNFILQNEADNRNNNDIKTAPNKISNYLLQQTSNKSNINIKNNRNSSEWRNKEDVSDRSSSPEAELYMNKLNLFDRELDTLYNKSSNISDNGLEDINYPPSTSSTELMGLSSDREDSGIHTADVSCSVSQADEPVEDGELASNTIPSCIEKLNKEKELQQIQEFEETVEDMENLDNNNTDVLNQEKDVNFTSIANLEIKQDSSPSTPNVVGYLTKDDVINSTIEFLDSIKRDASANLFVANISKSTSNIKVAKENITEQPIVKVDRSLADAAKIVKTEGKKKTGTVSTTHLETEDNVPTDQKNIPIYENVQLRPYLPPNPDFATDLIADNFLLNGDFSFAPSKAVEPPKVKPPPPPPAEEDIAPQPVKRLNSTKRIKKEIHLKRSSFLGLDEPTDFQIDPDLALYKPPDINYFLQNESKLEKSSYRKQQEDRVGLLNKGESQDSGLDIDRGRLSSDTWCSSMSAHERQDSGQTNSITSEEDEIAKKEREIIELIEKEEMSRDGDFKSHDGIAKPTTLTLPTAKVPHYEPTLGSEKFNNPYFPQISSDYLGDQDSEVLKVEQELRELEKEELKRQRHNLLFRESCAKARLKSNRHSLENICDETYSAYHEGVDHRKSMPELQHIPLEYRKSVPSSYIYHSSPENEVQYRKSMPNIQHVYQKSAPVYRNALPESDMRVPREVDHRKSMPELQHDGQRSTFKSLASNRQPILPGKPLRPICSKEQKEHFMAPNPIHSDSIVNGRGGSRNLTRHSIQALSAVPRNRSIPNDNWVQLRANPEVKNYNEHWLYQEAELRRLQDQQKNLQARNWSHPRQEKHLPDAVIQSLTQRVQNRMDRNPQVPIRRSSVSPNKDFPQHPYLGHPQTMGHALPVSYPPPITIDDNQDRMLSVSGKKKCSYCGNELGRGAAMIIESLCLFYHMECFKCCVCHMQLGDGLMGTDVRVRNQKLHCHNCYSSDDGVKFSCV